MSKQKLIFGFVTAGLFSLILFSVVSKKITPCTASDSAAYIEAARNLRAGKGLTVSTLWVYPIDRDTQQLSWWPPGYSLMIAWVSSFNINEKTAATIIPKFFFLLLPFAFFLVLRFFMRDAPAFASAVIITFMWPTSALSLMALSDLPFLFVSLLSFYLLFKSLAGKQVHYSFMAGMSAAFAVAIRYMGYNLFLGTVTGLLLALFMRTITRKNYFRIQTFYFFGFALGYLPLFLRNVFTLHTLQPFHAPPEPTTFLWPIIKFLKELACMLLGIWPGYGIYLAGLILLLSLVVYYFKLGRVLEHCRQNPLKTTYLLICISYLFYAILLFTFIGPRYLGGITIEFRLLIPYCWLIVVFFIFAIEFFCRRIETRFKFSRKWAVLIILVLFFAAQFYALGVWINREKPQSDALVKLGSEIGLVNTINALPYDAYIISNCGPYLRLLTGRSVRKLSLPYMNFTPRELADLVCPTRPLYVILVYNPGVSGILPASWLSIGKNPLPAGYRCVFRSGTAIILCHEKEV